MEVLPCYFDQACKLLHEIDLDTLFASGDINVCWANGSTRFLEIMRECIPQSSLRSRRNLHWLTKPIIQAIRCRNALFRAYKQATSNPGSAYQRYRAARNKVVAMLRLSKTNFFRGLKFQSSKAFWKSMKMLNKQDCSIPTLISNGAAISDNCDKASLLNSFFYKCFNANSPPLPNIPNLQPS